MSGVLDGRVALVTGAGSGLGRRFAGVLAEAGAAVVIVGRRAEALATVEREISEAGGRVLSHPMDVAEAAAIPRAFDAAEAAFGVVDIVVNNAGIADAGRAVKLPPELVDRVIDTNFRAPFLVATEAARRLIAAGKHGRIVNIASVGAFHYVPNASAALYSATKAGVVRLTEALALEWAQHGINVNAIAPGLFSSEMTDGYVARVGDRATAGFPRKRIGEPAFLDTTLLYLVDPGSHFVTGACIVADDGQVSR